MVDHRGLSAEVFEGGEDLARELGAVGRQRAAGEEGELAVCGGVVLGGGDVAGEVGEADAVDGAVGGEDVPLLVDKDAGVAAALDEAEVLEVDARVVDEVADVVVGEAGVLARGAEEAAAHCLGELRVHGDVDSELVAVARVALCLEHGLGDFAQGHPGVGERGAGLGAVPALGALAGELPVGVSAFQQGVCHGISLSLEW